MKEQAIKKRKYLSGLVLLQLLLFMATSTVMAVDTEEVITVLKKTEISFILAPFRAESFGILVGA